jgi:hypothetical protein
MKHILIRGINVIERFKGSFYVYTVDEMRALKILEYLSAEGFSPKIIVTRPPADFEKEKALFELDEKTKVSSEGASA